MAMPIYRLLSPVKSGGKRHMPGDSLDLSEKAGKDLARIGAVLDTASSGAPPVVTPPTGNPPPDRPPVVNPPQQPPQQPPANPAPVPPRTLSISKSSAKHLAQISVRAGKKSK